MKKIVVLFIAGMLLCTINYAQKLTPETVDLQQGLFAYYPFNGNANDESGNGHNAIVKGATLTGDRFGSPDKAYYFDGRGNTIEAGNFNLQLSAISISCWAMASNGIGYENYIFNLSHNIHIAIRIVDNKYRIDWKIGETNYTLSDNDGNFTIDPNHPRFDLLVLSYDGQQLRFFVNNSPAASYSTSGQIVSNYAHLVFGGGNVNTTYFNGVIDEIRLYNRAINEAEIQALYDNRSISATTPLLITSPFGIITKTSAESGFKIISDGGAQIIERGICWSSSPNPNMTSNKIIDTTGTDNLICNIKGLTPNTTYYVRAYAINSTGVGYGKELSFTTLPDVSYNTITDIEGNVYKTINIGTQTWMAENLKTTMYNDGSPISHPNIYFWDNDYDWCDRNIGYKDLYGGLYNWHTVSTGKICPTGWHVPSSDEWSLLTNYLGGDSVAGSKLKEAGTSYWRSPNSDATNQSGFSALPAGFFEHHDGFESFNEIASFWSSSFSNGDGLSQQMKYSSSEMSQTMSYTSHKLSVRCLKDTINSTYKPLILSTREVSYITHNAAFSGGTIVSDGGFPITARGICWSAHPNPNITDNKSFDSTGIGSYTSKLTNLEPGTTYFVKAYATNETETKYGIEFSFTTPAKVNYGSLADIEGNVYKTVNIGNLTWMGENLKTTKYNDGTDIPLVVDNLSWRYLNTPAYCWYNNKEEFKTVYGALYNGYTVNTGKLCPTDWHVPSNNDWNYLIDFLGGESVAGVKMKEAGTDHWPSPNTGTTNESGFTALPGGSRDGNANFSGAGYTTSFESTTEGNTASNGFQISISSTVQQNYYSNLINGFSVRCIKNSNNLVPFLATKVVTNITQNSAIIGGTISESNAPVVSRGACWGNTPNPDTTDNKIIDGGSGAGSFTRNISGLAANTKFYVRAYAVNQYGIAYGNEQCFVTSPEIHYGSVQDIDGNTYKITHIGTQNWMAENLRTTKYSDGSPIQNVINYIDWRNSTAGSFCWYENTDFYKDNYGAFYNFYAVTDNRNICPVGWHVPIDAEWDTLVDYLGGDGVAGGKMKETGVSESSIKLWQKPNAGATNSSGFSGQPFGKRNIDGIFDDYLNYGYFWSSSSYDAISAWNRNLIYFSPGVGRYNSDKVSGFNVRCLQDTCKPIIHLPKVITDSAILITQTSATSGGTVVSEGGTLVASRGVCWSTSPHPDTTCNKTSDGNGTGSFISHITGLTTNTTYYLRAYAINNTGVGYGDELSFKTLENDTLENDTIDLQNGLVAYYPFNGNANDESGNGLHGIVYGATLTLDRFNTNNRAYKFDGSDDYIEVPNNDLLNFGKENDFTFSFWIKPESTDYWKSLLSKGTSESPVYQICLWYGNLCFESGSGGGYLLSNTKLTSTTWSFCTVSISHQNGFAKFYINGQLDNSVYEESIMNYDFSSISSFKIGAERYLGSIYLFSGIIDNISIYSRLLNTSEIQALYNENTQDENISIKTPAISAYRNCTFEVPVIASNIKPDGNAFAYQFDYYYDHQKLLYQECSIEGTLSENGIIQVNQLRDKLSFAWAGKTPLADSGILIKLQFKALESGTVTPAISNFLLNTDTIKNITNGTITITNAYGDVDGNNAVQAYDAALALQYSVGLDPLPDIDPLPWEDWRIVVANIDGQDAVSAFDASLILQYTVGLINSFPVMGYKKSTYTPQDDVNVSTEDGYIVFRSNGYLYGLNVTIEGNSETFGAPQVFDQKILMATNISSSSYSVGLATVNALTENEVILKIPIIKTPVQPVTLNLIINNKVKLIDLGLPTGISDPLSKSIEMYPNPAQTILYFLNLSGNTIISIYDLQGREIITRTIANNQIDISILDHGLYTIQIENGKNTIIRKFIKQ